MLFTLDAKCRIKVRKDNHESEDLPKSYVCTVVILWTQGKLINVQKMPEEVLKKRKTLR